MNNELRYRDLLALKLMVELEVRHTAEDAAGQELEVKKGRQGRMPILWKQRKRMKTTLKDKHQETKTGCKALWELQGKKQTKISHYVCSRPPTHFTCVPLICFAVLILLGIKNDQSKGGSGKLQGSKAFRLSKNILKYSVFIYMCVYTHRGIYKNILFFILFYI